MQSDQKTIQTHECLGTMARVHSFSFSETEGQPLSSPQVLNISSSREPSAAAQHQGAPALACHSSVLLSIHLTQSVVIFFLARSHGMRTFPSLGSILRPLQWATREIPTVIALD